ncbi:MAG: aminopeptidase [Erysipelothrix sp.]|nr:aminopeptidase [Erysipelothrix sp.]
MVFKNIDEARLRKLADLAVSVGINVKVGQPVVITASVEAAPFVRMCIEAAYEHGAKYVHVLWHDDLSSRLTFLNADIKEFESIPDYRVAQYDYFIDEKVARLNIIDDVPGVFSGVDGDKMAAQAKAAGKAFKRYRDYTMANHGQWTIVAVPSPGWAQLVFPNEETQVAIDKMWEAILSASRVTLDNDPVADWKAHNEGLSLRNEKLNEYNFKALHFENGLNTDLVVGLADDHRWAGGAEIAGNGQVFNPNIPTEENFSMPHRDRVDGTVYSTKPLDYQGVLIEDFFLEFKDGKVINHGAKVNEEKLTQLLDTDEGSRHIGEVALISHDSPIQNSGILFYNTLFDENASCHLALGAAYPMNINGGTTMSEDELKTHGYNSSINHVDFMFGSADMKITGIHHDDREVVIFENGNFII